MASGECVLNAIMSSRQPATNSLPTTTSAWNLPGRNITRCASGLYLQEEFAAIHPPENEPHNKERRRAMQQRFIRLTQNFENPMPQVARQRLRDHPLEEMRDTVG